MSNEVPEEDREFYDWILEKARNTPAREIVEDKYVSCRILRDILYGRSKKFNRTKDTGRDYPGGISWLRNEYEAERGDNG